MAKYNISLTGLVERLCDTLNLKFLAKTSRSNQYLLKKNQSNAIDGVTLNKLLEAIISLAQS